MTVLEQTKPVDADLFEITLLQPSPGAQIGGIDLSQPLDKERHAALHAALPRHKVPFFRARSVGPASLS